MRVYNMKKNEIQIQCKLAVQNHVPDCSFRGRATFYIETCTYLSFSFSIYAFYIQETLSLFEKKDVLI